MEINWKQFCKEFKESYKQFEFIFQNMIIVMRHTPTISIFSIEKNGIIIKEIRYESAQDLLDKAMVEGRKIREIFKLFEEDCDFLDT